jgi:DNA-binding response OmpR family regulator
VGAAGLWDLTASGICPLLGSASTWDLIAMDRRRPGMDRQSTMREMREYVALTPALVLSALRQAGGRIMGVRAGCDVYLVEPVALGE